MTQVDTMLADKELSADMVPVLLMREQLKESHHIKLILVWVLIVVPSILGILTIILSQHLG